MQPELHDAVLFRCRPKRSIFLEPQDAYLIPFSTLFAAVVGLISLPLVRRVADHGGLSAVDCWQLVWVGGLAIIAAHLTVGRFLLDSWRLTNTEYCVTRRHVIEIDLASNSPRAELEINDKMLVDSIRHRDGTITVILEEPHPLFYLLGGSTRWPFCKNYAGFRMQRISAFNEFQDALRVARSGET